MLERIEEPEDGLNSQRPSRRKQAVQVARPEMWPSSASQPKSARERADALRIGEIAISRGEFEDCDGVDGLASARGSAEGGCRRGSICSCMLERSKASGTDGFGGNSEAMTTRDRYL